uniref:Ammonium transporter n=1 Tax=Mantoniella antarctica TaxID=81844 RepID=A0A7S0SAD7_9CHLO
MAIDAGSTGFMIICMAMVNLMTPGLAFFYGGLVRQQNVLTIIMQSFASMGLVTMVWTMWGFSLCFGESGSFLGSPASFYFMENVNSEPLPHQGKNKEGLAFAEGIPGLVFAGYQGMFAVISPALMTGAFADRMLFGPYLLYIFLWIHLVYFPFCHWVWGPDGWIAGHGVVDFAGGIVIHITAGFSALATCIALPHRRKLVVDLDTDPHNIPFVALGTGLLWFGWFGFNAGSALGANSVAAYAAINSEVSASCALFTWMVIEWMHKGKPTLVGACVGAIAGLATITPAAGFVKPWAAMVIGVVCAPFCYSLVEGIKNRLQIDDALDVFAVHGMGGYLGTVMLGIFADKDVNGIQGSGEQFGKQLLAATGCAVYSFVVGYALIKFIGLFMEVVPEKTVISTGLDLSMHGEKAYSEGSMHNSMHGGVGFKPRQVANPLKAPTNEHLENPHQLTDL